MRHSLPLLLALAAGCSATEHPQPLGAAAVEGTITTTQGEVVAGAEVTMTARRTPFEGTLFTATARTGPDGRFATVISTEDLADGEILLNVTVTPAEGQPYVPGDTANIPLRISPSLPPVDTARVALALAYLPD